MCFVEELKKENKKIDKPSYNHFKTIQRFHYMSGQFNLISKNIVAEKYQNDGSRITVEEVD
jgi:hypothetical protein